MMMLNNRLKIPVTHEDGCGDMVLMSSFLRELRNIYRDARIVIYHLIGIYRIIIRRFYI